MKIGILGGSFNPAHVGHLHISEIALKKLGLNQVWWLVSPQNPLKSSRDMAAFEKRMESALKIAANNPKIKVMDIESKLGTQYTFDTVKRLRQKFSGCDFVWLMGADNLIQLPKWKKWKELVKLVPIHVFDRAELLHRAVKSVAYQNNKSRIHYHKIRKSEVSSTEIRRNAKN